MNIVTIKNISLQFDCEEEVTKEIIESMVEIINTTLSDVHLESQPQILKQDNTEVLIIDLE